MYNFAKNRYVYLYLCTIVSIFLAHKCIYHIYGYIIKFPHLFVARCGPWPHTCSCATATLLNSTCFAQRWPRVVLGPTAAAKAKEPWRLRGESIHLFPSKTISYTAGTLRPNGWMFGDFRPSFIHAMIGRMTPTETPFKVWMFQVPGTQNHIYQYTTECESQRNQNHVNLGSDGMFLRSIMVIFEVTLYCSHGGKDCKIISTDSKSQCC